MTDKILLVSSCLRAHFKDSFEETIKRYPNSDIFLFLPSDERKENYTHIKNIRKIFSYDNSKFKWHKINRNILKELKDEDFNTCIIPFDDIRGERYLNYRMIPLVVGAKKIITLNKRMEIKIFTTFDWIVDTIHIEFYFRLLKILTENLDIPLVFIITLFAFPVKYVSRIITGIRRLADRNRKKIKVLYFISSLGMGGAQTQLYHLAKNMDREKYYFEICLLSKDDAFYEPFFSKEGIKITYIYETENFYFHSALLVRLVIFLLKGNFDVIHNWMLNSNIFGNIAGAIAGTKVIISSVRTIELEKYPWFKWWYKWVDILAAKFATTVIANSSAVATDYRKFSNVDRKKIKVIYNGLDEKRFHHMDNSEKLKKREEFKLSTDNKIIGFIGRLSEEKEPFIFLKAFKEIAKEIPLAKALVVGGGILYNESMDFAKTLGIDGNLLFLGHRRDVFEIMQIVDVIVLTSRVEGLPNVLIEAEAFGIPIVTTNAGGAIEVVENKISGFVTKIGDYAEIAEKTILLLKDKKLCEEFGRKEKEIVKERFSLEKMVSETISLYKV